MAQIAQSWPPNEIKHLGSALVFLVELNSEQTVKQPKKVFSRKHRAHCLNAVAGYSIAEHCKQILFPVIAN